MLLDTPPSSDSESSLPSLQQPPSKKRSISDFFQPVSSSSRTSSPLSSSVIFLDKIDHITSSPSSSPPSNCSLLSKSKQPANTQRRPRRRISTKPLLLSLHNMSDNTLAISLDHDFRDAQTQTGSSLPDVPDESRDTEGMCDPFLLSEVRGELTSK